MNMMRKSICGRSGKRPGKRAERLEEKKDEKDDKGKYVRRERYTGTCNRSFYVGSSIKHEDIHAKYENGILHVTFPRKRPRKKQKRRNLFLLIDQHLL